MLNYEKVHYVVNKETRKRISKFYSRRGDADHYLEKLQYWNNEHHEVVTMYCVPHIDSLWASISKSFMGLLSKSAQTQFNTKCEYSCEIELEDPETMTVYRMETVETLQRDYENQNHKLQ